jgi:hypothetical protein
MSPREFTVFVPSKANLSYFAFASREDATRPALRFLRPLESASSPAFPPRPSSPSSSSDEDAAGRFRTFALAPAPRFLNPNDFAPPVVVVVVVVVVASSSPTSPMTRERHATSRRVASSRVLELRLGSARLESSESLT